MATFKDRAERKRLEQMVLHRDAAHNSDTLRLLEQATRSGVKIESEDQDFIIVKSQPPAELGGRLG